MNKSSTTTANRLTLIIGASLLALAATCNTSQAYNAYGDGCSATGCHGDFRGQTSPKSTVFPQGENHDMHRDSASMATDCELCHTSPDRTPVYIGSSDGVGTVAGRGCSGCHVGSGLRKHHATRGVTGCYTGGVGCHGTGASDNPPAENVISPYYYEAAYTNGYTLAHNPANTAQVANTNENWSVGDFVGLDNDGNGLPDLADYTIGPFRILSAKPEGNNLRVTWLTAGGRTNTVQAASKVSGTYTNLSAAVKISGVGLVTTNYLEVNGATNASRFYRMKSTP
jgi:hypothetical protein